ncbi:MAG: hypothetical protein EOP83_05860 [Verrucomicrobiaceae bacterium]|nr:MAG: hypothetical protein EOP83_05860 [Verrucomicrobiaceae bacterium]
MKAYLIQLVGARSDRMITLVNEDDWMWMLNGGEPPAALVDQIDAQYRAGGYTPVMTRDDHLSALIDLDDNRNPDNDRAIQLPGSDFNGHSFSGFDKTLIEALGFINTHGLTLEDEYLGASY